jgi:hypothetical protein
MKSLLIRGFFIIFATDKRSLSSIAISYNVKVSKKYFLLLLPKKPAKVLVNPKIMSKFAAVSTFGS